MSNEMAEQLRRELFNAVRRRDGTAPFGPEDATTYLDDRRPLRVVDAHEQRIDRVRACAEADDGVYVLTLATANANRGLVAGSESLAHFYAFIPGGRMIGPADDDELADQDDAGVPVE